MWFIALCVLLTLVHGELDRMFAPSFFNDKTEGGSLKGLPFLPGMGAVGQEGPTEVTTSGKNLTAGPEVPEKYKNPFEPTVTDSVPVHTQTHPSPFELSPHEMQKLSDLRPDQPHIFRPQGLPNTTPGPRHGPDSPISHHIGQPGPEEKPHHEIPVHHMPNKVAGYHPRPEFSHPMGQPGQHWSPGHISHHEMPEHHMPNEITGPHPHPHPDPQYYHNSGLFRPVGPHENFQRPMLQQQNPGIHMPFVMPGSQNHHFEYPGQVYPNMNPNARPFYPLQSSNMHGEDLLFGENPFFKPGYGIGETHYPRQPFTMKDPYEPNSLWGRPPMNGDNKPMGKPPLFMKNILHKVLNGKFKLVANMMRLEAYPIPEKNNYPNFITGIPEPRESIKFLPLPMPNIFPAIPDNDMGKPLINPMAPNIPKPSEAVTSVPESKLSLESLLKEYQAMMESTHKTPRPLYETLMKEYQSMLESSHTSTTLPPTTPTVATAPEEGTTTTVATNTTPGPGETTTNAEVES